MLHFAKIPKKNGEIWRKFSKIWLNLGKFAKFWKKTAKNSAIFNEIFEIRERCWPVFPGLDQDLFLMVFLVFWDSIPKRCKGVHCVHLGESFPTSIYLQNVASKQPRTSLVEFARSSFTDAPGTLSFFGSPIRRRLQCFRGFQGDHGQPIDD